jgi:hypothetical protein
MQLQQRPGESALRNGDRITLLGRALSNPEVWVVWADRASMMVKLHDSDTAGCITYGFGTDDEGVSWLRGHGDEVDPKARRAAEVARALTIGAV